MSPETPRTSPDLVTAARDVLAAATDERHGPVLSDALQNLAYVLERAQHNPGKAELLSRRHYDWDSAPPPNGAPVRLETDATAKRADLATDDANPTVRITPLKGLVIASLLEEFAARLRQGVRTGAVDSSATDYIDLVDECAEHLQQLTEST